MNDELHPKFAAKIQRPPLTARGLSAGKIARIKFYFGLLKREDLTDDLIREGWDIEPHEFEAFLEYQDFIDKTETPAGELTPRQKLRDEIIKKRQG